MNDETFLRSGTKQKCTNGPKLEQKWKCDLCPKKIKTSQGLTRHVVIAHIQRSDQRKLVEE